MELALTAVRLLPFLPPPPPASSPSSSETQAGDRPRYHRHIFPLIPGTNTRIVDELRNRDFRL